MRSATKEASTRSPNLGLFRFSDLLLGERNCMAVSDKTGYGMATTDSTNQGPPPADLLSARDVAPRFGYRDRTAFWQFVKREKVPHVRLTKRNIRFPRLALEEWIAARTSKEGGTRHG